MNTVRSLKTVLSLQLELLRKLEQSEGIRRLWNTLNKIGSRNLANLPPDCLEIDSTAELGREEFKHWLKVFQNIVVRSISFTALEAQLPDSRRRHNPQYLWETFLEPLSNFVAANRLGELCVQYPDDQLDKGDAGFGYITSGEHMEARFIAEEDMTEEQEQPCLSFTFLDTGRATAEVFCSTCRVCGFNNFEGSWKDLTAYLFRYLQHVATELSANPAAIHTCIGWQEKLKKS